jgi:hypothetical protein
MNRMCLTQFDVNNRIFGPYLAATTRILISTMQVLCPEGRSHGGPRRSVLHHQHSLSVCLSFKHEARPMRHGLKSLGEILHQGFVSCSFLWLAMDSYSYFLDQGWLTRAYSNSCTPPAGQSSRQRSSPQSCRKASYYEMRGAAPQATQTQIHRPGQRPVRAPACHHPGRKNESPIGLPAAK